MVTSHYKIFEYSLPLSFKLYLRKQFFGNKAKKLLKKLFKNKQQLAMQLTDEFVPVTQTTYLLVDAWYTSGKLTLHALRKVYHPIGRIKSNIEASYRHHKNSLGFDEYQVESLTSIKRFWSMVFMTYIFLELFRVSTKKSLKLNNIGDIIGYFRNNTCSVFAKFAYTCAVKGANIDAVITKLGMVHKYLQFTAQH